MKMKKVATVLIIMLYLFVLPVITTAKEIDIKKKYPPYPDIWGYDLSDYPAVKEGHAAIRSYYTQDGDIIFRFKAEYSDKPPHSKENPEIKFLNLKFFEGKFFEVKDFDKYEKENKLGSTSTPYGQVKLKDGSIIKSFYNPGGRQCNANEYLQYSLIKGKLKPGEEFLSFYDEGVEKVSILATMSKPYLDMITDDHALCSPGGRRGLQVFQRLLYFLPSDIIGLQDDTFIALYPAQGLIIRFDKNFQTKFKPQHDTYFENMGKKYKIKGNFFVIPYSKIEELYEETLEDKDYRIKGLHDRILFYLYEEQKE